MDETLRVLGYKPGAKPIVVHHWLLRWLKARRGSYFYRGQPVLRVQTRLLQVLVRVLFVRFVAVASVFGDVVRVLVRSKLQSPHGIWVWLKMKELGLRRFSLWLQLPRCYVGTFFFEPQPFGV